MVGDYPTVADARKAGELLIAMRGLDSGHLRTPAEIDRVRRELAKQRMR